MVAIKVYRATFKEHKYRESKTMFTEIPNIPLMLVNLFRFKSMPSCSNWTTKINMQFALSQ